MLAKLKATTEDPEVYAIIQNKIEAEHGDAPKVSREGFAHS